jgi:hypothetical protein
MKPCQVVVKIKKFLRIAKCILLSFRTERSGVRNLLNKINLNNNIEGIPRLRFGMTKILGILALLIICNFGFGTSTASAGWTTGKYNSAIDFNGTTTYVDGFGAIGNIKSVSFWIKADDITSRKIMDFDGTDQIEIDGSGNILATSFPGTVAIYIDGVNKTASPIVDTDWHHIAITTDTNVNASAVVIGKVSANYFDGTLDDVKIYAYARSTDEILLDYNSGVATHLGPSDKTCSEDPAGCVDYGLVGSWGMDEGTGTTAYDTSDNSNDGSLTNGPTWTTDSSPLVGGGGSLKFDGVDDYVDCGQNNFNYNEGSIGIWINTSVISPGRSIFSYIEHSVLDRWITFYIDSSKFHLDYRYYTVNDHVEANTTIQTNEWIYCVVTSDGSIYKIYINGVESNLTTTLGNNDGKWFADLVIGTYDADIGRWKRSISEDYIDGYIDSVRIYNRALSAEEVRYHYNKGGPVAEWKFDEGSGQTAFDESFNNNDGTLGGTSAIEASDPTWVEGKYGGALSFDGGDYVDAGDGASLDITDAITIVAWIKANGDYTSDQIIVHKLDYPNRDGYTLYFGHSGDDNEFKLITCNGTASSAITSTVSLSDNDWHFIVATSNASGRKIYFDGVLDETAGFHGIAITEFSLKIGGYNTTTDCFNGSIDDVRIYNYARSAEQIQMDYNAGVATHFR